MRTFSARETEWLRELDGIELASFWRRALAFVLDCLLVIVLFTFLVMAGTLLYYKGREFTGHSVPVQIHVDVRPEKLVFNDKQGTQLASVENEWAHLLYYSLTPILYFGLLGWITKGRSLGKWIFRIRVVSIAHRHLTLWHSIERALGYGAALLEFGFGFVQFFIHPYRRCAQDRLAETIVVTERGYQAIRHKFANHATPKDLPLSAERASPQLDARS
jgi:uncharacterized RDD family membrane protein YckC